MNILIAFLAFNFIIIIHELGHFIVARLAKVRVHEFSLFIGPKLFSVKRGDTTFSIRCIPALAYVKLEGEEEYSENEDSYSKKSVPVRMAIIAAGPFTNIVVPILLFAVMFMIGGYNTNSIREPRADTPAYSLGLKEGDKIISYNGHRIFQPLDLYLFQYASKGNTAELVYERAGNRNTTTIKPKYIAPAKSYRLGISIAEGNVDTNVLNSVEPASPAQKAGMAKGDRIIKLNDTPISGIHEIQKFLLANKLKPLTVTYKRSGKEIKTGSIVPVEATSPEGYDLGLDFTGAKAGLIEGLKQGFIYTYSFSRDSVYSVGLLFTGKVALGEMMGPVGIVTTISYAIQKDIDLREIILKVLSYISLFSIGLGISNLLPIPPADGSKLVFLSVEAVRRKPIPFEKEAAISTAGFVLMMVLFVVILYNDIYRLLTGFFTRG